MSNDLNIADKHLIIEGLNKLIAALKSAGSRQPIFKAASDEAIAEVEELRRRVTMAKKITLS